MREALSSEQMKQLDLSTIQDRGIPSLVLMERAALAVVERLEKGDFLLKKVLIVCGTGNNGADGVAIGRMLHLKGYQLDLYIVGNIARETPELKTQVQIAKNYGVSFINNPEWDEYTTIVDAIFGVGLSRDMIGINRSSIDRINQTSAKVLSVDIPSGIHGTLGKVMGTAVQAYATVTFAFVKIGLLLYPGASYAGMLHLADIGIYKNQDKNQDKNQKERAEVYYLQKEDLIKIPSRCVSGNKGTFGKVLLIAGTHTMSGAAYLCANACMRTGAGMIKICTREENREILQMQLPEAMLLTYQEESIDFVSLEEAIHWADVIGIGPGIGRTAQAEEILTYVLEHVQKPFVLDADALYLVSKNIQKLKNCQSSSVFLTPHLGEMSSLTGLDVSTLKENILENVQKFANHTQTICICKDARTCIATPKKVTYLNLSGNEGMATAGAGDVLTGILLGLLAQGMEDEDAASLAVYLHGAAGDKAKDTRGSYSMMAQDIIDALILLLKERGTKE